MDFDPEATGYIDLDQLQPLLSQLYSDFKEMVKSADIDDKY